MVVRARNTYDDGEVRSDNWFAKQLGDGWQTSGDGIYTYVGETSETSDGGISEHEQESDPSPNSEHSLRR